MNVSADVIRQMMDLGFTAVNNGWLKDAQTIFDGVEAVRGDEAYGPMGTAMVKMAEGDFAAAATEIREKALKRDPDNMDAKKLLALALKLDGRGAELDKLWEEISGDASANEFLNALK